MANESIKSAKVNGQLSVEEVSTTLDIQFSGGASVKYSYSTDISESELTDFIQSHTEARITTSYSTDMVGNSGHNVAVQFSGNKAIDTNIQSTLLEDLNKQYPDAGFKILESGSIDASMGFNFLLKCLTAVAIASILMVIYVTLRFKKIGGLSAGVTALIALFHDVVMIYFMYVFLVTHLTIQSLFTTVFVKNEKHLAEKQMQVWYLTLVLQSHSREQLLLL